MASPFTVTVHGTYARDEIPPRCRKPRPVTYDATATVDVASVTGQEAPVAFRITKLYDDGRNTSEIRTYQGRLFAPYKPFSRQVEPTVPGDSRFPAEVTADNVRMWRDASTAEEFRAGVSEYFAQFLVIDGGVWVETAEPGYLVTTFGLGGGSGSTALMVSTRTDHGTLFRADEFEAACAHAAEVSRDRGDPAGRYEGEGAEQYRAIDVLVPEAVTLVTVPPEPVEVRDLRFDYDIARDRLSRVYSPDEETDAFEEVVRLREAIIRRGYTPVESDARPYEARAERVSA